VNTNPSGHFLTLIARVALIVVVPILVQKMTAKDGVKLKPTNISKKSQTFTRLLVCVSCD